MKKKVTFSGGFHNCKDITLHIVFNSKDYEYYKENRIGLIELIDNSITRYQRKRLERHFCGIKYCTCGGWIRADIEIVD